MLRKKPSSEFPSSPRPLAIVVADDVAEIQLLISTWLGAAGHQLTSVNSGRELLRIVREQPVDLVITDLVMPDGDGHDAIATLSRLHPNVRVVAMSGGGNRMPTDPGLRLAKGLGADALLSKPFTKEQLLAAVEKAARR
jgi:CheY-like chemotaxis protein